MSAAETKTVVRALCFEVMWPGWRDADRLALWQELWRAQDDLRRAANLTVSAIAMLKRGVIPWPEEAGHRGAWKGIVRPVPLSTLINRALRGEWQPYGEPLYIQSEDTRKPSSQVFLDLSNAIEDRITADWKEIQRGQKSLPTWKSIPIGSTTQGLKVDPEAGTISMPLWAGNGQRVTLRPRKLDARMWRDLQRAIKFGSAKLQWNKIKGRKGRWDLSLSATYPAKDRSTEPLLCAIRLGMRASCTLAFANPATGRVERFGDVIDLPASAAKAVARVRRERTMRGRWNRKDRGLRVGRGRDRKLRVLGTIGDTVSRVTETAVRQTAASAVAAAIARGSGTVVVPDTAHWSVAQELDRTRDMPHGDRAAMRKWYFDRHQGELRAAIESAAEREGLTVMLVSPAGIGKTCSACGKVDATQRAHGRWHCSCGAQLSAEVNSARVLAGRALAKLREGT